MRVKIDLPINNSEFKRLNLGDILYLNGIIITARDQAHMRVLEYNEKGKLPKAFAKIEGSAIYHCGPIIKEENGNYVFISGGPTTSQRMDALENDVVDILNIKFIIGKGGMKNLNTRDYRVAYLSFTGGCGAIVHKKIEEIVYVEWLDLGLCEAVWFLKVENFGPLVLSQFNGKTLY